MVGKVGYEVQVLRSGRWVIELRCGDEKEGRSRAQALLGSRRYDGVRLVKDWERRDGTFVESEIFAAYREESDLTILPLEEAPALCEGPEDFNGIEARIAIGRLFRPYFEQAVVTPTEAMHNHAELKRLTDKGNLVSSAVAQVATLQAGADARARRDALFDILDRLGDRARRAAARADLPSVSELGIGAAIAAIEGLAPAGESRFLSAAALCGETVKLRDWLGKLEYLAGLAEREPELNDLAMDLLDNALADVLGVNSVVQDLLGFQPGLGAALLALADLSEGRLTAPPVGAVDSTARLNTLFAQRAFRACRYIIVNWMSRQLRAATPLVRTEPEQDPAFFRTLLERLVTPEGVFGDATMAEALTLRFNRFLKAGGAAGRTQSIAGVVEACPDGKTALSYLLALAGSGLGAQHRKDILIECDRLLDPDGIAGRFTAPGVPIKRHLEQLTALYRRAQAAPLPDADRRRVAERIDGAIAHYIVSRRVVERLDNPKDLLRHRAIRLMHMCEPGVLVSPTALGLVRERVLSHLRQPDFEQKYVADIADPARKERMLRDFFALLHRAGFH